MRDVKPVLEAKHPLFIPNYKKDEVYPDGHGEEYPEDVEAQPAVRMALRESIKKASEAAAKAKAKRKQQGITSRENYPDGVWDMYARHLKQRNKNPVNGHINVEEEYEEPDVNKGHDEWYLPTRGMEWTKHHRSGAPGFQVDMAGAPKFFLNPERYVDFPRHEIISTLPTEYKL